jgi:1-acyl-sn-glycerol-3-phosphate acyltransferase
MTTIDREFQRMRPAFDRWASFVLIGKKIIAEGTENFIEQGPSIIVGNHIGTVKDIAAFYKVFPRTFVCTANRMIMDKNELDFLIRKHLKRHFKEIGLLINMLLKPLKAPFVDWAARTVKRIGTIPVDLYSSKRDAILKCQEAVKEGTALVTLHGRGRVMKDEPNPYVSRISSGAAIVTYNLYENDGLRVPVTPMVMFGTHLPLFFPAKIWMQVGEPMYVTDYLGDSFNETVERFRAAIETKVNGLFFQIIKSLK